SSCCAGRWSCPLWRSTGPRRSVSSLRGVSHRARSRCPLPDARGHRARLTPPESQWRRRELSEPSISVSLPAPDRSLVYIFPASQLELEREQPHGVVLRVLAARDSNTPLAGRELRRFSVDACLSSLVRRLFRRDDPRSLQLQRRVVPCFDLYPI